MTGPVLPDTGFLRIRHVLNFIPVSRSTFWENQHNRRKRFHQRQMWQPFFIPME